MSNGRRVLDVSVAAIGLAVLSPLMGVIWLLVRVTSPGPAIHTATRITRGGREFSLYKFRSMKVGASAIGPGVTVAGDPRITPIGRFIRKSKLDELPQLVNVIRGDMALVGPRPEDPRYVAWYSDDQREILNYRPGITGAASIIFRDEEGEMAKRQEKLGTFESAYRQLMGEKIEADLQYCRNSSVRGDLKLIAQTVSALVSRRNT